MIKICMIYELSLKKTGKIAITTIKPMRKPSPPGILASLFLRLKVLLCSTFMTKPKFQIFL